VTACIVHGLKLITSSQRAVDNASRDYVTTADGSLVITTRAKKTSWTEWDAGSLKPVTGTKNYTSGAVSFVLCLMTAPTVMLYDGLIHMQAWFNHGTSFASRVACWRCPSSYQDALILEVSRDTSPSASSS